MVCIIIIGTRDKYLFLAERKNDKKMKWEKKLIRLNWMNEIGI
jgi:hypothetical protein